MSGTARELILAKSPQVQEVLKILMTRISIDQGGDLKTLEQLAPEALEWWDQIVADASRVGAIAEEELAAMIIERVRKQEVWGKILRGNAN